jgi:hypothetical protein
LPEILNTAKVSVDLPELQYKANDVNVLQHLSLRFFFLTHFSFYSMFNIFQKMNLGNQEYDLKDKNRSLSPVNVDLKVFKQQLNDHFNCFYLENLYIILVNQRFKENEALFCLVFLE